MKSLLRIFFLIRIMLSGFAFSQPAASNNSGLPATNTTNYYKKIILYYIPNSDINELLSRKIFQGFSETEILKKNQATYFYAEPLFIAEQTNPTPRSYQVVFNKKTQCRIISHEQTAFRIHIYYNSRGDPLLKKTFYQNRTMDTVVYIYRYKKLFCVRSELYGYIYFREPETFTGRIRQYLRRIIPNVF